MKTITAEQFKKMYGDAGISSFGAPQEVTQQSGIVDTVSSDIASRSQRVGEILDRPDTGIVTKGVQVFGQGAGLAAGTIEDVATRIPGIKQAAQGIGAGINWLTTSDFSPIKPLGELIGSSKTLQSAVSLYDTDQNFKDTVDAVANIVRLGGDVSAAVDSANFTRNVTNKVIKNLKSTATPPPTGPTGPLSVPTKEVSAGIMNRVARLKPTDTTKFESLSNKTPGQYLVDTGNFGAPDKIISTEATKFVQSKNMVDAELSKLPGLYREGAVKDALTGLLEKAKSTSGENVRSSYYDEVNGLIKKYNEKGLTMSEINRVKRLYEKEVRLGYIKLLNPDKVELATNIDSSLRRWQVQKAKELGFNNITDLNKQTQISRFLIDKLGDQVIGQSALNSIGLTDWIVLGSGSPQAVSAFLTKKFFSSKAVQAKIAELLNRGEPVKGMITPDVQPTIENSLRIGFPEGTRLELPAGTSKSVNVNQPIELRGASSIEAPAKNVFNQDMVNSSSKPTKPPESKKIVKPLTNNTKKTGKKSTQGGYIDIGKMTSDVTKFLKTMPEYGLLEDLRGYLELYDFGILQKGELSKNDFKLNLRTQLDKRGVPAFDMSDRKLADFADAVLKKADAVPKNGKK